MILYVAGQDGMKQDNDNKNKYKRKRKQITIGDLQKELLRNPGAFEDGSNKPKKAKRTRRRVENPKQQYMYAAQRIKLQKNGEIDSTDDTIVDTTTTTTTTLNKAIAEAKRMGLVNPAGSQHCDPLVDEIEPKILGQIRVGEEETGSGTYAYVIEKPQGWSILGGSSTSSSNSSPTKSTATTKVTNEDGSSDTSEIEKKKSTIKRIKIKNSKGDEEVLEFDESDVLALLSPEERAEIESEGGSIFGKSSSSSNFGSVVYEDEDENSSVPGWCDVANMSPKEREEAGIEDEDFDPTDIPEFTEADILAVLSPEERSEYEADRKERKMETKEDILQRYEDISEEDLPPSVVENLKRIKNRLTQQKKDNASFASIQRPSVVSWLKDKKSSEGNPIRGGKFWTALAGATEVDDTGCVLLCPKDRVKNLFVDYAEYVAVVGNGNHVSPTSKKDSNKNEVPKEAINMDMMSRLKRNRDGDVCQTVRFVVQEHASTCSSIISHAQNQFEDGIRGDPAADPFDRRAPRRLIHCNSLTVSSLLFDESVEAVTDLPDDIAVLSDRLNNHKFQ